MEEKKKLKITVNKKIVTFSLIALSLLMLVSTSYAYFTAVITGNDTAKQTSFTSGTMSVELINTEEINLNGMMPGESTTVHFSVKNTGKAPATYGVGLLVDTNDFRDQTDLVYTITSDNDGGSKNQSQLPAKSTTPSTLIPVVSIPVGITQNYTMTITFRETNDNQNDNQGRTFAGKVQIDTLENSNYLAAKVVSSNKMTDYENLRYWEYNQNVSIDTETANNGPGICLTDSFDNFDLGKREFSNYTCDVTNPEDYIGWYTFGYNDNISGYEIYKINAAQGTRITNVDIYNITKKQYDGVIRVQDENGTSYVNRGSIKNNYVSFANKTWRIVRVNGDGTIRLVLNDNTGIDKAFNTVSNAHKYVGYTYDNDHMCTKANPCTSESGTNSTIKDYLENEWYISNIASYEDKIAISSYCNNTVSRLNGASKIYKANDNVLRDTASLKCEDTSETYGGYYKLKIGLLSADEIMIAGLAFYDDAPETNYLYHSNTWWSFSPSDSTATSATVYASGVGYVDLPSVASTPLAVYPVINLKADTVVTSGNGTESSPYVVS